MASRSSNTADSRKRRSRLTTLLFAITGFLGAIAGGSLLPGLIGQLWGSQGLPAVTGIWGLIAGYVVLALSIAIGAGVAYLLTKTCAGFIRWLFGLGENVNGLYMFVARFYPLDGNIKSIQNIIKQHQEKSASYAQNNRRTGVGTWWHWENYDYQDDRDAAEEPAATGTGNAGTGSTGNSGEASPGPEGNGNRADAEGRATSASSRVVNDSTDGNRWFGSAGPEAGPESNGQTS